MGGGGVEVSATRSGGGAYPKVEIKGISFSLLNQQDNTSCVEPFIAFTDSQHADLAELSRVPKAWNEILTEPE